MAQALRMLGFTVYDWPQHESIHGDEWLDIYCGRKQPDFASMYKDVDAVTDLPAAFWFQEIYEVFPSAKVVLTIRDSEDVWAKSWAKQQDMDDISGSGLLTRILLRRWLYRRYYALLDAVDSAAFGSLNSKSTVLFKKKYREHNERVQAVIPEEKLFIFNVKQGWKPLCKFLGCAIPEQEPFPCQNVGAADCLQRLTKRLQELRCSITVIIATLFVLLSACYFFGH